MRSTSGLSESLKTLAKLAIAGGLIYWLIIMLLKPLQKIKSIKWLRPLIIIAALWLFSLLAGGQPSVLRSAVMFTCIVMGDSLARKSSATVKESSMGSVSPNPFADWSEFVTENFNEVLD